MNLKSALTNWMEFSLAAMTPNEAETTKAVAAQLSRSPLGMMQVDAVNVDHVPRYAKGNEADASRIVAEVQAWSGAAPPSRVATPVAAQPVDTLEAVPTQSEPQVPVDSAGAPAVGPNTAASPESEETAQRNLPKILGGVAAIAVLVIGAVFVLGRVLGGGSTDALLVLSGDDLHLVDDGQTVNRDNRVVRDWGFPDRDIYFNRESDVIASSGIAMEDAYLVVPDNNGEHALIEIGSDGEPTTLFESDFDFLAAPLEDGQVFIQEYRDESRRCYVQVDGSFERIARADRCQLIPGEQLVLLVSDRSSSTDLSVVDFDGETQFEVELDITNAFVSLTARMLIAIGQDDSDTVIIAIDRVTGEVIDERSVEAQTSDDFGVGTQPRSIVFGFDLGDDRWEVVLFGNSAITELGSRRAAISLAVVENGGSVLIWNDETGDDGADEEDQFIEIVDAETGATAVVFEGDIRSILVIEDQADRYAIVENDGDESVVYIGAFDNAPVAELAVLSTGETLTNISWLPSRGLYILETSANLGERSGAGAYFVEPDGDIVAEFDPEDWAEFRVIGSDGSNVLAHLKEESGDPDALGLVNLDGGSVDILDEFDNLSGRRGVYLSEDDVMYNVLDPDPEVRRVAFDDNKAETVLEDAQVIATNELPLEDRSEIESFGQINNPTKNW